MIEASFDAVRSRKAAVSRIYQYDTGQKLRLHGLPSQGELTDMDELLYDPSLPEGSRPVVASALVQYGYEWSERSEDYAAIPQEDGTWVVDLPDEYLSRADPVHMYVYVYHGEINIGTEEDEDYLIRGRTIYEGVFTPIARPAPSNTATPEQLERWEALTSPGGDVYEALAAVEAANENAQEQAAAALAAAAMLDPENADVTLRPIPAAQAAQENAEEAYELLRVTAGGWERLQVTVTTLAPGADPTAAVTTEGTRRRITLGVPKGETGDKGPTGARGPKDITITAEQKTYGNDDVRYLMRIRRNEEDE